MEQLGSTPTPEEISELFEYRDGRLYWKKGRRRGKPAGCSIRAKGGYFVVGIGSRSSCQRILRHRLVFCVVYGRWPKDGYVIDHINRVKGDDRIENLREVIRQHNHWNTDKPNVSFREDKRKWMAAIVVNYKKKHLGCFDTKEEAEKAYYEAKLKYHVIPDG